MRATGCGGDLPAAQAQIAARGVRPIGTTGKSVKPVQPLHKKFSASRETQITPITPRISSTQGALATSRTRGERRWTRRAQLTLAPDADGEVVWFWRRGAGVKFSRSELLGGDGGNKAVHRGEHEVSRNPSRRESRDASAALYARVQFCLRKSHARPRVQRAPGFPCALGFRGGRKIRKARAHFSRENADAYPLAV